jgi:hypothetical protein
MTEEHRPYRTRTTVLFAARAPKAVILRRGPRTHYQLILWDTATDTFEPGQWMRGNVRLADLPPSGDKLIYFAEQFRSRRAMTVRGVPFDPLRQRTIVPRPARPNRKIPRYLRPSARFGSRSQPRELRDGWTAISTPPYFSALAIWPSYGRWTGGGTFRGDRDILLRESEDGSTPIENVEIPSTVRLNVSLKYFEHRLSAYAPSATETAEHAALAEALLAAGLLWVDWISLRDDLLFAGDGRIFRLGDWRSLAPVDLLPAATILADFRDASFQQLRAPASAMQW